jgi:hypothetical protein
MNITQRLTGITFGVTAVMVGIIAGSVWLAVGQDGSEGRTQYESFQLDTPTHAIQTFVDTFQSRDYAGLFLIFSPDTQQNWSRQINMLNFDQWAQPDKWEEVEADIPFLNDDFDQLEQSVTVAPYLFDQVMLAAEQHDAFLIDLRGNIEVAQIKIDPNATEVNVPAMVEGIEGEVIFRLVKSPSERWRVQQVIVPGGDEEAMPWSVPAQPESDE